MTTVLGGAPRERLRVWWRRSPRLLLVREVMATGRLVPGALAFLVLLAPVLTLTITIAGGVLVGSVPAAVRGGFDSPAGRRLLAALAVLGSAFVLEYAASGARDALAAVVGRRVDRRVKARVVDASLSPPGVAHVEDPEVLDKIAMTRSRISGLSPGQAATAMFQVAVNRLRILPPFGILIGFRWWLPFLMGASLFAVRQVVRKHILASVQTQMGQTAALRRSTYLVDLAITPGAAKESRVFGLASWIGERFRTTHLSAMRVVWAARAASRRTLFPPLAAMLATEIIGYRVVVLSALHGDVDLARLTILIGALGGLHNILSLSNEDVQLTSGGELMPVLADIEEALAARREDMGGTASAAGMPASSVRFEDVCFHYPGSEHEVYAGLDLELRAGESLAVVGVNGAGKTTLVKLLARLHDPTAGRITVDGVDLRDLDPSSWQRRVAAIFQDFTRYELSAADNVSFGALELAGDRAGLDAAAEQAGAADIIESLPHGWDTTLSRRFSGGVDLSGGQWQRIALARALLAVRGGAGILVLDEPTANLDVRAEAELYDRFLELTKGVTTVVISHRFSTVRRADRIVVLDQGRVVEDGSHDELVARQGHYARMFMLQAARFAEDVHG
jgi:ATP-binding cassette subfamily B protein